MSYIDKRLSKGEQIIDRASLHWFTFLPLFKGVIILIVIELVFAFFGVQKMLYNSLPKAIMDYFYIFYLCLFVFLVAYPAVITFLRHMTTEVAITNENLIYKRGWLNVDVQSMRISKIENKDVRQSIVERLVKAGFIRVVGSGGTGMIIGPLANPHKFINTLKALEDDNGM